MAKNEKLIVKFYDVKAGWLSFQIKIGQQFFEGRFSSVFDPILDFKFWLEAIAIGVQQTSFRYNPEGNEIKFNFVKLAWNNEVLIIQDDSEDVEIYIQASIKRKQLVKAFYLGFLTFTNSVEFKSDEWEVEYMKEKLCKKLNLEEHNLIDTLIELDRLELIELFFIADPTYTISYPTAKSKEQELEFFVKDSIGEKTELDNIQSKNEWSIPEDYNFWSTTKKIDYIHGCIQEPLSGFHGTKINDFRSKIIEEYLLR